MSVTDAVQTYVTLLEYVLPFAIVYGIADRCVKMVLQAAINGKVEL